MNSLAWAMMSNRQPKVFVVNILQDFFLWIWVIKQSKKYEIEITEEWLVAKKVRLKNVKFNKPGEKKMIFNGRACFKRCKQLF